MIIRTSFLFLHLTTLSVFALCARQAIMIRTNEPSHENYKNTAPAIFLPGNSNYVSAQKNDSALNYKRSYYYSLNIGYAGFGLAVSPGLIAQVSKKRVLGFSYLQTIKYRTIGFSSVPENISDAWSLCCGTLSYEM